MTKHTSSFMVAGLLTIGLVFGVNLAQAQAAGSLDTTFGTGGTVSTSVANIEVMPRGAFEQSNGDIVVISTLDQGNAPNEIGLARYTSAGVLDTTFGKKGITATSIAGFSLAAVDFAVQPN